MKRILIIEDDQNIRENLAEVFLLKDYEVKTSSNGKIALGEALTSQPHLIICDIMMPEMDGYSFVETLRSVPQFAEVPVIFLTALSNQEGIRKGLNLGADDYITKPFDPEHLLEVVTKKLKRQQHVSEAREKIHQKLEEVKAKVENLQFFNSHELRAPISNILGLLADNQPFEIDELLVLLRQEAEKVDAVLTKINKQLELNSGVNEIKKIFLIDDDPLQHRLNKHVISRAMEQTEICHFYNGFEALAAYQDPMEEKPDIIFLDLNMPVMNGLEVLRAFENMENPPLLFVLSSSINQREIELVNRHSFVTGFLHKPLNSEHLQNIFNKY